MFARCRESMRVLAGSPSTSRNPRGRRFDAKLVGPINTSDRTVVGGHRPRRRAAQARQSRPPPPPPPRIARHQSQGAGAGRLRHQEIRANALVICITNRSTPWCWAMQKAAVCRRTCGRHGRVSSSRFRYSRRRVNVAVEDSPLVRASRRQHGADDALFTVAGFRCDLVKMKWTTRGLSTRIVQRLETAAPRSQLLKSAGVLRAAHRGGDGGSFLRQDACWRARPGSTANTT